MRSPFLYDRPTIGGATGGLDDRFDMILYSKSVSEPGGVTYIANSLTEYGNDGNQYNDSINQRPNNAVPDSIADALHYASDHLPVYSLFEFRPDVWVKRISNNIPDRFSLSQNFPNPFNPITKIKFTIPRTTNVKIIVYDILGSERLELVNERLVAGSYEVDLNANGFTSGIYFYKLITDDFIDVRKMILMK